MLKTKIITADISGLYLTIYDSTYVNIKLPPLTEPCVAIDNSYIRRCTTSSHVYEFVNNKMRVKILDLTTMSWTVACIDVQTLGDGTFALSSSITSGKYTPNIILELSEISRLLRCEKLLVPESMIYSILC